MTALELAGAKAEAQATMKARRINWKDFILYILEDEKEQRHVRTVSKRNEAQETSRKGRLLRNFALSNHNSFLDRIYAQIALLLQTDAIRGSTMVNDHVH